MSCLKKAAVSVHGAVEKAASALSHLKSMTASSSRVTATELNGPSGSHSFPLPNELDSFVRTRRASPSYEASERPVRRLTPERSLDDRHATNNVNGNGSGNGYSNSNGNAPHRGGFSRGRQGGGSYFEERRRQREESNLSIWPASPKTPRDFDTDGSDEDKAKSKKRRKEKKRKEKEKRSSRKRQSDSEGDSEEERRRKKKRSSRRYSDDSGEDRRKSSRKDRNRSRRSSRSRTPDRIRNDQEDEWQEASGTSAPLAIADANLAVATAPPDKSGSTLSKGKGKEADLSSDDDVGPKPYIEADEKRAINEYGGALLKGEGEAMAAFVTEGKRIPRRGEIGLESTEIEAYENAGFVMSGSRHRRMNAVRIRKENQVISAEEKRGIIKLQKEEQAKKESMIVSSFKELVERRLQGEKHGPQRQDED